LSDVETELRKKRPVNLKRITMSTREVDPQWPTPFVAAAVVVLVCLGALAAASQGDLLQSLVEKNEAAWQRIQSLQSVQYTVEQEWLDRQSQRPLQAAGQVKKSGNCCWSTYRQTIHSGPLQVVAERKAKVGDRRRLPMQLLAPDTSAGLTEETETRVVVNDKYVARWPKVANQAFAYQEDYNSVDGMSVKMKQRLRMSMPPDPLQDCFGTDTQRFRELLQSDPNRIRFDAVGIKGQDGNPMYQIRRFYPKDGPRPDLIWTIDPQKGSLVTESVFYAERETPVYQRTMRAEEVAPGIWYPVERRETRYAEPNQPGGTPIVEGWNRATIKDIKVDEPIPDEQFDIEALGLNKNDPNVIVWRTTLDGTMIRYVYRDGKLVPR